MGYEALQAAIANFRGEIWKDDHEEGALVCKCFGVDEGMIERAVRMNKLTSIEEVTAYTKAGGGCLTCFEKLEEVLEATNAALVAEGVLAEHEAYRVGASDARKIKAKSKSAAKATTSPLAPASPLPPPSAAMTNLKKMRIIEEAIEEMRPHLRKDGGDCELVDVDGSNVLVSLTGACVGCQMASVTVSGIQERLIARLGTPLRVVPVKQHAH
jgi:NifU-like protein